MRIGIDGLPLTEPLAGVGNYTLEIARILARSDDVDVVAPKTFLPSVTSEQPGESRLSLSCEKVNMITGRWWSIGLPRYIRQNGFDVFHGTNFEIPLQAVCPSVVTIHDLSLLLHPETHERRRVWRARRRLSPMARRATMIITDSETVRSEVHEHLGVPLERIATVHLAARAIFRPMKPEKGQEIRRRLNIPDKFVLYAGTIEPRKNLCQLVRAFEKVSKEMNSDLQLVLAGRKGWLVDDLYKSLRKSPAGKNVVFTGYLNDNELCALYSSCRLFVYPSFYEGFGLPPLEAMACGAPVIASSIPSIAEVVGPAARLVSPHSSKELADAMGDVLSNDSMRQELVAAGAKRAMEFSWESTAERTRAVYLEAIDRFKHS